jgi:hypothetical protein
MKNDLERFEARIMRGHILKVLKIGYPGPTSVNVLELTLSDRSCPTSPASIKGQIQYLIDKGYIKEWEKDHHFRRLEKEIGIDKEYIVLTPKGIDLLEGVLPPDPGVSF